MDITYKFAVVYNDAFMEGKKWNVRAIVKLATTKESIEMALENENFHWDCRHFEIPYDMNGYYLECNKKWPPHFGWDKNTIKNDMFDSFDEAMIKLNIRMRGIICQS